MTQVREVAWDTETTGLNPQADRIIEIACVEIIDFLPTGKTWQALIDPECPISAEVTAIHGITNEMVRGKPKFRQVVDDFLKFIGDSRLIAHNATFDMGMMNAELARIRRPALSNPYVDTLALAKRRFPGSKASLDDLCRRFGISLASRVKHEAMIDTKLLAQVYLELNGGRHREFTLDETVLDLSRNQRPVRPSRGIGAPTSDELTRHDEFLVGVKNPLWRTSSSQRMCTTN